MMKKWLLNKLRKGLVFDKKKVFKLIDQKCIFLKKIVINVITLGRMSLLKFGVHSYFFSQ